MTTVQELLETHRPVTHGHVLCECRREFKTDKKHRAHLITVLEAHTQEQQAMLLEQLADEFSKSRTHPDEWPGALRQRAEAIRGQL